MGAHEFAAVSIEDNQVHPACPSKPLQEDEFENFSLHNGEPWINQAYGSFKSKLSAKKGSNSSLNQNSKNLASDSLAVPNT